MFSPYYAWARRRGAAEPQNHCAMNLALYGPRGKRWAMTERGHAALSRDDDHLAIGPSRLWWQGGRLTAEIDEIAAPLPRRLRGRIRVTPEIATGRRFALDPAGQHHWWPLAPRARVEVEMSEPACRWQGGGYLDCNAGEVPLEQSFRCWDWSRAHLKGGAALLYDRTLRNGDGASFALRVGIDGQIEPLPLPRTKPLPATGWRVARHTRVDRGFGAEVARTLEDTPFYARSILRTHLFGEPVTALHESLDLDRFRHPLVQMMLPFRMPRRA
ncbi:MAG: carotenoid 1,2-hydratase [Kiloniellaceae bacterium]